MSPEKRKARPVDDADKPPMALLWDRTALWFKRNGRQTIMIVLVLASAYGAWYVIWDSVRPHMLASEDYVLTVDKIELSPPVPRWIRSDLRADAIEKAGLTQRNSLMDENLLEQIRIGFSLQPWVAKVINIERQYPARVIVRLEYRRPACFVDSSTGYYPVDSSGVLLPSDDFTPAQKREYPRLGVDSTPNVAVGRPWEDAKVTGGAQVADMLRDVWTDWRLSRISLGIPLSPGCHTYYIFTLDGDRVFWGPGDDAKSPLLVKLTPEQKLARLTFHLEKFDSLGPLGQSNILDVYRLPDPPESRSSEPETPSDS